MTEHSYDNNYNYYNLKHYHGQCVYVYRFLDVGKKEGKNKNRKLKKYLEKKAVVYID